MISTLTFRKRIPQKRRRAILSAVNPCYRPKLTPTALTIRHPKTSIAPVKLFLMLWRDFISID